jgi:hypothetical protein
MTRDAWSRKVAEMQLRAVKRIGSAQATHQDWKERTAAEWNGNVEPVQLCREVDAPPLVILCRAAGIIEPIAEYVFAKPRRWRFDFCWPAQRLALEINGGVWTQGRHTRGQGAIDDMEKLSEAAILGWRVLYVIPKDIQSGVAMARISRAIGQPLRAA